MLNQDKTGFEFKARIRDDASCGIDFGFYRWPKVPMPRSGKVPADAEFTVELCGTFFEARRPGFGIVGGDYGNGSIHLRDINDLICADEDRERVIAILRAKKQEKIDMAVSELVTLEKELHGLR